MKNTRDKQDKSQGNKKITRREFFKLSGTGVAAVAVMGVTERVYAAKSALKGKKLAMVIDLQKCTGCGGCYISCKNENNVQEGVAWSNRITKTSGKFPNVKYYYMPTLCNHCEKAPCVRICPAGAMYKDDNNVTAHDPNKCIGCKNCRVACPYDVISYNSDKPHKFWKNRKALIDKCTESAQEVSEKTGDNGLPYYNPEREANLKNSGLRMRGVVEKCTLCDHRLKQGKLPYCVESCPANARILGDLNDPSSDVNKILGKFRAFRLKEHLGTEPKVFYVRNFNTSSNYESTKGEL